LLQKLRTSASEDPPLSEKCPHWTNPPDCGRLLWTAPNKKMRRTCIIEGLKRVSVHLIENDVISSVRKHYYALGLGLELELGLDLELELGLG